MDNNDKKVISCKSDNKTLKNCDVSAEDEITLTENATNEECNFKRKHHGVCAEIISKMPDEEMLIEVAELFKVFGDSTRTKIISALRIRELCVDVIAETLNMTKSAVSHQLRILRQTKIVKYRKSGKEVIYSLNDEHINRIYNTALEHVGEGSRGEGIF